MQLIIKNIINLTFIKINNIMTLIKFNLLKKSSENYREDFETHSLASTYGKVNWKKK
jgi:hypothetical protein